MKPLGIWREFKTTIMGISTRTDFEVIEPRSRSTSYPALVGQPWGIKMKVNIYLDKDSLKIKGKGKNDIISLNPRDGQPWEEPGNNDANV